MAEIGSNKKKRAFVEAWAGDEVEAMRIAGYSGSPSYLKQEAIKLLNDPHIQKAIKTRDDHRMSLTNAVASRTERQAWWTSIMRNKDPHRIEEKDEYGNPKPIGNIPLGTRLKASEMLGKSEMDFITQIDVNHSITVDKLVLDSIRDDTPIEEIEAEYYRRKELKQVKNEAVNVDSESTSIPSDKPMSLGDFL